MTAVSNGAAGHLKKGPSTPMITLPPEKKAETADLLGPLDRVVLGSLLDESGCRGGVEVCSECDDQDVGFVLRRVRCHAAASRVDPGDRPRARNGRSAC